MMFINVFSINEKNGQPEFNLIAHFETCLNLISLTSQFIPTVC